MPESGESGPILGPEFSREPPRFACDALQMINQELGRTILMGSRDELLHSRIVFVIMFFNYIINKIATV